MTAILTQVVFEHRSGLPEDRVVNNLVWATAATPPTTAVMDDIADTIDSFYNTVPSGHNALAGFLAPALSRTANASLVKFYDLTGHLDGSAHGSPIYQVPFTLAAAVPGAEGMPSEVAACLSFRAGYGTDAEFAGGTRPRSRDRGRIYLGPLTKSVTQQDSNGRVRLSVSFQETILSGALILASSTVAAWSVWSRANANVDPVMAWWVDDAFDTQRRRGEKPQGRLSGAPV